MAAEFWIRRTPAGTYTINDLGLTVEGSGAEIDLLTQFDTETIVNSSDLVTALGATAVTRLDGPAGSPIAAADAFKDIQPQLPLTGDADTFLDGQGNFNAPKGVPYAQQMLTGWIDTDQYDIAFTDGTRTLDITPQGAKYEWYQAGVHYEEDTGDSIVIPNTEGRHLIYYNGATLSQIANPTSAQIQAAITDNVLVCFIYWDATNAKAIYIGYESHTAWMPAKTHINLHRRGALYTAGSDAQNILADQDGSLASHAQFGISSGSMLDEDVPTNSAGVASTVGYPIYHLEGAEANPDVRQDINAGFPVVTTGTGRLAYNQLSGGTWSVQEVTNNGFVLCHVLAINDSVESRKLITVMGQSEYGNINDARAGAEDEMRQIVTGRLVSQEIVKLYTFILQTSNGYTNAVKARIRTTDTGDDYIDWRFAAFSGGAGSAGATTFSDADFGVFNSADPTKEINLDLSSITTGTQRTMTAPDRNLVLGGKAAYIKPGGGGDYTTIAAAIAELGSYGTRLMLEGGVNHDIGSAVDVRGTIFIAAGGGYPTIRAQTGGSLQAGGTYFYGCKIECPTTGFTGTYLIDIDDAPITFKECSFSPETGKYILGASSSQTSPTIVFVNCGQPNQNGGMIDSAAPLTTPFPVVLGTNGEGIMQFGAWDMVENNQGLANTSGAVTGIPSNTFYVSPGENIQARLDSVGSDGGAVILLPGIHDVTTSLNITKNKTMLRGIGHPTIRALNATWTGGTTGNDAVINVGSTDGLTPVDDCDIWTLAVSVEPNIHGIQVNGGEDNHVHFCTAYSTALKSSLRVGFLFTDSSASPGERFIIEGCLATSASGATAWVDGIHFDGGTAYSAYGYNNGITDSIMKGNLVRYCRETTYAINYCTASAIFNNRGNEVSVSGTSAFGMALIDCEWCNVANNSLVGSNATGSIGIGLLLDCQYNSIEENIIDGDGTVFSDGISVDDGSDYNVIKGNIIDYCTWGVYVYSGCENNVFENKFLPTITTPVGDVDGDNQYIPKCYGGTGSPSGVVTGVYGDMYENNTTGDWYRCTSYPSGTSWALITGSTVWGSQYYFSSSEGSSQTTSTSYQTKVTMTTGSLPSGNYLFQWQCEFYDANGNPSDVQARNGTTEIGYCANHDDVMNTYWRIASGFQRLNLSGVQTFDIRFRAFSGTIYCSRARIMLYRES